MLVVLFAVVVGSIVRLWSLTTPAVQIDGDQAVTGVMVDNILAGRGNYVFVAGQQYNGALEQWLQAAMYWVLPLPRDPFTLRLVDVALMAACCWLVFVVGRLLLDGSWRAALAAALFAAGPYWTLWKGDHSDGAYPSLLLVGLVGLWFALRLGSEPKRRMYWAAAGLGFCAGAVVWLGQSGIMILIPGALWVAPVFARSVRPWLAAVPAAVIGAAPSLLWSIKHGIFAPTNIHLYTGSTTFSQRVHNTLGPVLREFIGIAADSGEPGWPLWLQHATAAALGLGILIAYTRRRRGILAILTLNQAGRRPIDALLLSVPIVLLIYMSSKSARVIANPHYLFTYTPVLLWLLAAAAPSRRGLPRSLIAAALVTTIAATSLTMLLDRADSYPGTSDKDLRAAAHYLRAHGDHDVYADFWTAMPLQYFAGTSLRVAPMAGGKWKFPVTSRAVDAAPSFVYVDSLRNDSGRIAILPSPFKQRLLHFHVHFQEQHIGTVTIYRNLNPPLKPWQLKLGPRPPTPPSQGGVQPPSQRSQREGTDSRPSRPNRRSHRSVVKRKGRALRVASHPCQSLVNHVCVARPVTNGAESRASPPRLVLLRCDGLARDGRACDQTKAFRSTRAVLGGAHINGWTTHASG